MGFRVGHSARIVGSLVLCVVSSQAFGHTTSGGNCGSCHGDSTGRMEVTGNSGLLTVNPRLDGGSTAALKVFDVKAGETAALTINVINGGAEAYSDRFGIALTGANVAVAQPAYGTKSIAASATGYGTRDPGVQNSLANLLTFTPDAPEWITIGKDPRSSETPYPRNTFYYEGPIAWTGSAASYTFDLAVDPSTPPDVYSLFLRASGVDDQADAVASHHNLWTQSEEVLLNVRSAAGVPEPGTVALLATVGLVLPVCAWRSRRRALLRRAGLLCLAAAAGLLLSAQSYAHMTTGGNCGNCHGADAAGRMNVSGNTGIMSVNPRLDNGSTAPLKVFTVHPGESIPLTINVTKGGATPDADVFAIALTGAAISGNAATKSVTPLGAPAGAMDPGVMNSTSNSLFYALDAPTWTAIGKTPTGAGAPPLYTYLYEGPFPWSGSTTSYTYNMAVDASTPADVYSVFVRAAGVDYQTIPSGVTPHVRWTQGEEVLVNVVPEPATLALLAIGVSCAAFWMRRARRRTA